MLLRIDVVFAFALVACTGRDDSDETGPADSGDSGDTEDSAPTSLTREVLVNLDGVPVEGARITQGGGLTSYFTGADGRATVTVDLGIEGDLALIGTLPVARSGVVEVETDEEELLVIELEAYDPEDNESYEFLDPGSPTENQTTQFCAHCHHTINEKWWESPHRRTADNPVVQDLYAGAVAALAEQAACENAGGRWWTGIGPGTGAPAERCYLGVGTLPDLNPDCGVDEPCDGVAEETGACADCHAPAINGVLGGRDLLEATGIAYEDGVSCDVCHKVESIDPEAPAGVAGRLVLHRPSELATVPLNGPWKPMFFGPYVDVANPIMGAVPREHFRESTLCSGCHQLDQEVLVPDASADVERWPDGLLPIHSTYEEWRTGPIADASSCQGCHMPPDAGMLNAADHEGQIGPPGIASGWVRPPGAVRKHEWGGPRTPASGLVQLAAAVSIDKAVSDGELVATVTVTNVGCGHALPTGEPLRSVVLRVEASCGEVPLEATGGDAVPDYGGAKHVQAADADWSTWPDAEVGDLVRVVRLTGAFRDYTGFGSFGDGTFTAEQKGLLVEEVVGMAVVTSTGSDGVVTFDRPLPDGDLAYLGTGEELPVDGDSLQYAAGAPGFAFARVLADADGNRMVPHHRAVDVVSDNRLLPTDAYTTAHRFASPCENPVVHAVLVHRPYPPALDAERGWAGRESVLVETQR